jgi:hypothetical protein
MAPRKRRAPAPVPATADDRSITVALPPVVEPLLASQKEPLAAPAPAPPSAAACSQHVDRAIVNNAELRANSQDVLSMIRAARPKNTTSAYEPKQREFRRFCQRKQ